MLEAVFIAVPGTTIIRPPNFNDNIIHSLLNQRFQFSIGNLDVVLRHPAILCERERERERACWN